MNSVAILIMSEIVATVGLFKIKVFWNKSYGAIISVHDVTSKILSCQSNYIVDVTMWLKFCKYSISMIEVIITLIF